MFSLRPWAVAALVSTLCACASPGEQALGGAAVGGLAGAGIGGLAGGTRGAVIGGVGGAAAGAIIGAGAYEPPRRRTDDGSWYVTERLPTPPTTYGDFDGPRVRGAYEGY